MRPFDDPMAETMTTALERNCQEHGIPLFDQQTGLQGIGHHAEFLDDEDPHRRRRRRCGAAVGRVRHAACFRPSRVIGPVRRSPKMHGVWWYDH